MSNLYLDLNLEKIDWDSEDSKSEISTIKSFEVPNVTLTKNFIEDLYSKITRVKEDWINLGCDIIGNNYYIDLTIIFHSLDLGIDEQRIVNRVLEECDSFLKQLKSEKTKTDDLSNFESLYDIEDGYVIKAHENGGWGIVEDLTKLLTSYGISYKIIREQNSRHDGGASGGFEEITLFIGQTVFSGVTWDVLKSILITQFGYSFEDLMVF